MQGGELPGLGLGPVVVPGGDHLVEELSPRPDQRTSEARCVQGRSGGVDQLG